MNSESILFLDLPGRPQLKRVQRDVVHRANPVRRRMPANQKPERMGAFAPISAHRRLSVPQGMAMGVAAWS